MNMLGTLMLSLGTPMMLAGDEFGNSQSGNNNAYAQDNDITWLNWDWIYQPRKTMQMHRLETVSRLLSIRKSLGLYHHEEFFTRLTQLGLFKPSSRVQWYLPDGTTPMDRDWFDTTIRSFAMRLLSQDEVDVLIVINGVDEVRRFTLPSDCPWQCDWSSATAVGLRPAPGDRLQRIGKNQALRSNWIMSVSEKDNIHQLLKTVQASLAEQDKLDLLGATTEHADVLFEDDEQAPGVGADVSATMSAASTVHGASTSARDGGNATVNGSAVWTMPALSISVMRRLQ